MRAGIPGACSALADIVGPGMNSRTITSTPATCSRTFGPMPVVAAALVLNTSFARSIESSSVDCPGRRITYLCPSTWTRKFSLVRPPDSGEMWTSRPFQRATRWAASSILDMRPARARRRGLRLKDPISHHGCGDHLSEDLNADCRAGLQLDRQIRIGEVAFHGEAVSAAAQPADDAAIAQHSLAAVDGRVLLVADRERAQAACDLAIDAWPLFAVDGKTKAG